MLRIAIVLGSVLVLSGRLATENLSDGPVSNSSIPFETASRVAMEACIDKKTSGVDVFTALSGKLDIERNPYLRNSVIVYFDGTRLAIRGKFAPSDFVVNQPRFGALCDVIFNDTRYALEWAEQTRRALIGQGYSLTQDRRGFIEAQKGDQRLTVRLTVSGNLFSIKLQ